MFKKILAVVSMVCMTILCLAGCPKNGDSNKSSSASSSQQ